VACCESPAKAHDRGVSHDDLITAIKSSLPADATSSTSGVDATAAVAEKIASTGGMPPANGPRGPNGPGAMRAGPTALS
jgi:hypothetical protein